MRPSGSIAAVAATGPHARRGPEGSRSLPRDLLFEDGEAFGADRVDLPAQFLDARGEPFKLLDADAVMLRLCRARNYAEWTWDASAFR